MATATDVPGKFDCVINGQGYTFDRTRESTLYGSRARAEYSYSPTFLERTNVSGAWGDNQQEFWLTFSQSDWSGGEELRFARPNDPNKSNRYWLATNIDSTVPGQVTPAYATNSFAAGSAMQGLVAGASVFYAATNSNLLEISEAGVITDRGAHGAGSIVTQTQLAYDGKYVYIPGQTKIRRFDTSAHTFADFSATVAIQLCYQNNTLFGASLGILYQFDTAGTATTLYTFKDATGTASNVQIDRLIPYGGQVALLVQSVTGFNSAIYLYNGAGVTRVAGLPNNFLARDIAVVDEILVIGGLNSGFYSNDSKTAFYYYANGSIGLLFQNSTAGASGSDVAVGPAGTGFYFSDPIRSTIRFYDIANGAAHTICSYTPTATPGYIAVDANGQATFSHGNSTDLIQVYGTSNVSGTATITSSLIDFDSTLSKYVKGITVDFIGSGSVDLAYQLNDLDGSWTNLQTGATSGTEYTVGQSCRSIGVKVTLNPAGGLKTPTLKRVYVRAVPQLQTFRARTYNLDLTNTPNNQTLLQDGSIQPLTGHEQVTNLITAIISTTPISITDRFGTYTAVLEPGQCNFLEQHSDSGGGKPANSGQFVATITAREV